MSTEPPRVYNVEDPEQALEMLSALVADLNMSRATHLLISQGVENIRTRLRLATELEKKEDETSR